MARSRSRSREKRSASPESSSRRSRSKERKRRRRSSSASSGGDRKRRSYSPRYSRSRSPYHRHHRSSYRSNYRDHRDHRHHALDRENPPPSNVLGVFGLSYGTDEYDLEREFGRYGTLENIRIVRDPENRSRGFGFIDFKRIDDAKEARRGLCDKILDGKKIRVDFSLTKEPHGRTPGQYLGSGRWSANSYHHRRRSRSYSPDKRH